MSESARISELRRRRSSGSTVKASDAHSRSNSTNHEARRSGSSVQATLWVHDDSFSTSDVLINESILEGSGIVDGSLIEISNISDASEIRDFQLSSAEADADHTAGTRPSEDNPNSDQSPSYLCIASFAQAEFKAKQANLQISIKSTIALAFGFRSRSQVLISLADFDDWTASHVEITFRDAYMARSDMWRLVGQELAGRTVYAGQKITFLGSLKVVIKTIHIGGHKVPTAFFSGTTIPVFRSEAARYVVFIQMSQEMWDFDTEGNGEILFNRVINGFLPDLFKRWTELDVRHLVSIILFGRLEYTRHDFQNRRDTTDMFVSESALTHRRTVHHQDFYRVVVTDMASAQWTTILNALKKDFQVFLRDISLYPPKDFESNGITESEDVKPIARITGLPTTAMKGNILEAINIASTQLANDYIDRDLIRTGLSVVVVTAGSGVFEVDKDLLNLTSENLTNNGIGIDVVCLSKMPLHSVPLFKYRSNQTTEQSTLKSLNFADISPRKLPADLQPIGALESLAASPALSSVTINSLRQTSAFRMSQTLRDQHTWLYGIPHWIDLSYWSAEQPGSYRLKSRTNNTSKRFESKVQKKGPFVPRVRMYEIQMMGLMEMGMADISIPFMLETQADRRRRRRRAKSISQNWPDSRSQSHSPALSRKGRISVPFVRPNVGLLSTNAKAVGETFEKMDDYDDRLFQEAADTKSKGSPKKGPQTPKSTRLRSETARPETVPSSDASSKIVDAPPLKPKQTSKQQPNDRAGIFSLMNIEKRDPKTTKATRNTSLALRGLAPPIRAVASTEVNVENIQAQPARAPNTSNTKLESSSGSIRSYQVRSPLDDNSLHVPLSTTDSSSSDQSRSKERPTKPISINNSSRDMPREKPLSTRSEHDSKRNESPHVGSDRESSGGSDRSSFDEDELGFRSAYRSLPSSVPKSNVPFLRNVNASNPLKRHPNREVFFGKWQHLYPRKPRAATVKWRSLCTPASVPLTTEDFPPKDELETEYNTTTYSVALRESNELLEVPETRDKLLREMLCIRFAHGYQLVVGSRKSNTAGPGSCDSSYFFKPDRVRPDGEYLYMSMGNTIQKIALVEANRIQVTKYVRKPIEQRPPFASQLNYNPHIKTILSAEYSRKDIELKGYTEEYPWELADNHLAVADKGAEDGVQTLRFWRARFVLLPVEPPANVWKMSAGEMDDNDEEIHLRGIRALTQMWQKSRYIPPEERRPVHNRMSGIHRKDRNPLQIDMETLNPSELVATELDKLLAADDSGEVQSTQLLPESEQFDRETATVAKMATAIQGERGIEIKNRRWHLRLHYSCFQGEEFTNWLVHNIRDIATRTEAVEFGNILMKEGLFEHVNDRHNFKDGNYFYSIRSDWRAPRQENRQENRQSWFPTSRRSDRSVPPTPISENVPRESPLSSRSRSGSNMTGQPSLQPGSELHRSLNEKKGHTVLLSKMIRLDVDHRKRSNRPEIVNLHYDRLHNPENCYHLELNWLNVTSKLVDDAIVSWTSQAERYGLKLVEVPLAEACEVPKNEPFRAPYRIKLISEPPKRNFTTNSFFTATSFSAQTPLHPDLHTYQKALLKRFNFVLDLEAVSEFPENVEICYSWGKLNYQYTQFVHRSGVILAQITNEGDILLLANRLYNSRLASASAKDSSSKFDPKKDNNPNHGLRPAIPPPPMQPSGIVGLNVQSPSPHPSPMVPPTLPFLHGHHADTLPKISADVLGSRRQLGTSASSSFVTPEQIKDDMEAFCHDKERLEAFFKEVTAQMAMAPPPGGAHSRRTASTSSSVLRPIREPDPPIPEFRLPEALNAPRRKA